MVPLAIVAIVQFWLMPWLGLAGLLAVGGASTLRWLAWPKTRYALEDDTLLLLFNKSGRPISLHLPTAEAGHPRRWEAVAPFDEAPACPLVADEPAKLGGNALLVLRAVFDETKKQG